MCSSRVWYMVCMVLLACPVTGQTVERGDIAPAFTLPLLTDTTFSAIDFPVPVADTAVGASANKYPLLDLQHYSGKVIYLDFWHSACLPCRQSLPALNRLRQRLGTDRVEIIGVNLDRQPRLARAFLSAYPVDFPVVSDVANTLIKVYGLDVFPSGFVIDGQGVIRYVHQGFNAQHVPAIELQLRDLLTSQNTRSTAAGSGDLNAVPTIISKGVEYAQR